MCGKKKCSRALGHSELDLFVHKFTHAFVFMNKKYINVSVIFIVFPISFSCSIISGQLPPDGNISWMISRKIKLSKTHRKNSVYHSCQ